MTCVAIAATLFIYVIDWDMNLVTVAGYMLIFAFFTTFLLQVGLFTYWVLFRPLKFIHLRRRSMRFNPFARLFVHEAGWRLTIGFGRIISLTILLLCFAGWVFILSLALNGLHVR